MTTAPALTDQLPKDPRTGLTLPLSKSLASPELRKHRALVAVELEVLSKKFDRFGWERDRNTPAHDRLVSDWMEALQDYPLDEVQAACRAAIIENPKKMPNEGHIIAHIRQSRAAWLRQHPPAKTEEPARPEIDDAARERMKALVASAFPSISTMAGDTKPIVNDAIAKAAKKAGVSVADIRGDKRDQPIAHARQAAMWIAHQQGVGVSDIGAAMNRDRTTIIHGLKAVESRIKENQTCKS